jgi:uncharacterized membrane protein
MYRGSLVKPLNQKGVVGIIGGLASLLFGLIIGVLALRFVFRLLGANPANGLVAWIYNASAPLVSPFFGIFNTPTELTSGRLEFETLIAILVYGIIASIIMSALNFNGRRHAM